jgi:hypothetical protein
MVLPAHEVKRVTQVTKAPLVLKALLAHKVRLVQQAAQPVRQVLTAQPVQLALVQQVLLAHKVNLVLLEVRQARKV